eukprot:11174546-Lingulodinium_polyedra.AAC.1
MVLRAVPGRRHGPPAVDPFKRGAPPPAMARQPASRRPSVGRTSARAARTRAGRAASRMALCPPTNAQQSGSTS